MSDKPTTYLFVQNAHSGSFVPVEGEENLYTLTMEGVSPQTIYFSDRPKRDVGQVPMGKFLDELGFVEANPPNAALDMLEINEVVVVELFNPEYSPEEKRLQYRAIVLEQPDHSYAVFNEKHDQEIPAEFGSVALFIDDCGDRKVKCQTPDGHFCGYTHCCQCWNGWTCTFKDDCCSERRCSGKCQNEFGPACKDIGLAG